MSFFGGGDSLTGLRVDVYGQIQPAFKLVEAIRFSFAFGQLVLLFLSSSSIKLLSLSSGVARSPL